MSRILINDGNETILVETVILAESTAERMKGLLVHSGLDQNSAMLIRPCSSIHMWFMRFPIDAAFLDRKLRVLKISRNLRPWQMALAPRQTHCVLETARGALAGLQIGDLLTAEK